MFNWLLHPSKPFAENMEAIFAVALLLTTALVVVGLIGEYRKSKWWVDRVHVFEMLVVIGVAGELITETGAFWYSHKLQVIEESAVVEAQKTANASVLKAGELGVSVDNLNDFVAEKEKEAGIQYNKLRDFVSAEDKKNAEVIAELNNDRETLDKARTDAAASVTAADKILSDMKTALAHEEKIRDQMLEKLAPRNITPAEQDKIRSALSPFKGQVWTVTSYWESREPMGLTLQLYALLTSAGWTFDESGRKAILIGGVEGVLVYVNPKASTATISAANALVSELNSAGISAVFRAENDRVPDEKLTINIGSKP